MTKARCRSNFQTTNSLVRRATRTLVFAVLARCVHSTWYSLRGDAANSGSFSSSVRLVEDPSVASRRTISSWGLRAAPLLSSRHGLTYVVANGPLGGVAAWTSTCSQKVRSSAGSRRPDTLAPQSEATAAGFAA